MSRSTDHIPEVALGETPYETDQRRSTLDFVIIALFVASMSLTIYNLQFKSALSLVSLEGVDFFCILGFALNRMGRYTEAAILTTSMSLVAVTFNVYDGYGLFDSGMVAYPLVIVLGAMVLGRRAVKWLSFASLVSLFLIGYLQWKGFIHVRARAEKIGGLIPITVFIAFAGLIIRTIMLNMEKSLAKIRQKERELRDANDGLEERVAHREAELREVQARVVAAEKVATLGRISAGLAHEMNTPLGVIVSGSGSVRREIGSLKEALVKLLAEGDAGDRSFFVDLLASSKPIRSEVSRKAKMDLADKLEAEGLPDARSLADRLLNAGLAETADDLEAYLSRSAGRSGAAATEAAFLLADLEELARTVNEAAQRGHRVIEAIGIYSEEETPIASEKILDLGIELGRAVESLSGRAGHNVRTRIERHAGAFVSGHADRLRLVWSNLLKNALDALDGEGNIVVRVGPEGDRAVVEVEDSGGGVAPEDREKLFTPLYTTKGMGAGIGIGLDVAARIVEEHHGSIDFQSEPGRTIFRVCLPLADQVGADGRL